MATQQICTLTSEINIQTSSYVVTKMKILQQRKRSNHRDPGQPTIQDSFLHGRKLPTNCKEHKQLLKVLQIGWQRMDNQSIQLKSQVLNRWLRPFVLDISCPVIILA